jgi:hypothetical protein
MATGYRLKHLTTGRLSQMTFTSAISAALHIIEHAPRTASDYVTVPVTVPCDCGLDYEARTVCCDVQLRGALADMGFCTECRDQAEIVLRCPKCGEELDPSETPAA